MAERVPLSSKIRFEVFKRDSFTCQYCGKSAPGVILEVDHIVPVSGGGDNDMKNLITACHDCNIGKGAIPLDVTAEEYKFHKPVKKTTDRAEAEKEKKLIQKIDEVKQVCVFKPLTGNEKKLLKRLIGKFGVERVATAFFRCVSFWGSTQVRSTQWKMCMEVLETGCEELRLKWV